jgi:uncharacterized protein YjbI with pentapeptide repeats
MSKLTLKKLQETKACSPGIRRFIELHGKSWSIDKNMSTAEYIEIAVRSPEFIMWLVKRGFVIQPNCTGVDISNRELSRANFSTLVLIESNLSKCKLHHTRFMKCDLTNANFTNSDLTNAVLINATLQGADFSNSDLTKAVLSAADLRGVKFATSKFQSTIFYNPNQRPCRYSSETTFPVDFDPSIHHMELID